MTASQHLFRLTSGQNLLPILSPIGRARGSDEIPRSARSRSNGFVSFSVAGRTASRTTKPYINEHSPPVGRTHTPPLQLWNFSGKASQASAKSIRQGLTENLRC